MDGDEDENADGSHGPTVARERIEADLRALGVERGDDLVVHSSLSSLGWVEGGPDAVVDALRTVVGTGTVAVPTFTFGEPEGEPFDPADTPSRTGAVTETLRTRPGACRSHHPSHAVAALGPDAADVVADHPLDASLGPESPIGQVCRRGGRVLLLGVGHTANSSLHVAEALADLPFKGDTRTAWIAADGEPRRVEVSCVGCSRGFGRFGGAAAVADLPARGTVGAAEARLFDGPPMLELARALLAADPGVLLCDEPDCWWCPEARDVLADHDPRYRPRDGDGR